MKKLISLICVLVMLVGVIAVGAVSAGAVEAAQTIVDVKSGDKVTYVLTLADVPERIVGCDFSVYYDSSALKLDSVADFTNTTDDWSATINPNRSGEVLGNWSILSGVDFSKQRNFVTLNMTATKDSSAHLSYYVRYMYGNSAFESDDIPQISKYTFNCDVSVNGKKILENANPELNIDEPQKSGLFVNSVTGDSGDASVNIASGQKGYDNSVDNNSGHEDGDTSNGGNNSAATTADGKKVTPTSAGNVPGSKTATVAPATDAEGNTVEPVQIIEATASEASSNGPSPILWIIIGVIVLLAAGGIVFFVIRNKKGSGSPVQ